MPALWYPLLPEAHARSLIADDLSLCAMTRHRSVLLFLSTVGLLAIGLAAQFYSQYLATRLFQLF